MREVCDDRKDKPMCPSKSARIVESTMTRATATLSLCLPVALASNGCRSMAASASSTSPRIRFSSRVASSSTRGVAAAFTRCSAAWDSCQTRASVGELTRMDMYRLIWSEHHFAACKQHQNQNTSSPARPWVGRLCGRCAVRSSAVEPPLRAASSQAAARWQARRGSGAGGCRQRRGCWWGAREVRDPGWLPRRGPCCHRGSG
jgi:hypothetical protein